MVLKITIHTTNCPYCGKVLSTEHFIPKTHGQKYVRCYNCKRISKTGKILYSDLSPEERKKDKIATLRLLAFLIAAAIISVLVTILTDWDLFGLLSYIFIVSTIATVSAYIMRRQSTLKKFTRIHYKDSELYQLECAESLRIEADRNNIKLKINCKIPPSGKNDSEILRKNIITKPEKDEAIETIPPIIFEKITRENIGEIPCGDEETDKEVIAISFAEVGAMGDPGEVKIVVRDKLWRLKGYTTNYQFGVFEDVKSIDSWREEQEIIFNILPVLREINFNGYMDGHFPAPIRCGFYHGVWEGIDMGFGNHLLARTRLGVALEYTYKNAPVGKLYDEWPHYVAKYAYEIGNNIM